MKDLCTGGTRTEPPDPRQTPATDDPAQGCGSPDGHGTPSATHSVGSECDPLRWFQTGRSHCPPSLVVLTSWEEAHLSLERHLPREVPS